MTERFKKWNDRVSETTKDIKIKNWFPLLLYLCAYIITDLFMMYAIFRNPYISVDSYLRRMIFSNLFLLSSFIFMFGKKTSAILFAVSELLFIVYGFAQMCYSHANKTLFRISAIFSAKEGTGFAGSIMSEISTKVKIGFIVLIILTAVVTFVTLKFSSPPEKGFARKFKYIVNGIILAASLTVVLLIPYFLSSGRMDNYGSFDKYNYINFLDATTLFKRNDLFTCLERDVVCTVKQQFTASDSVENINNYFEKKQPHQDNDMTGIFKDKNLIVVQMESLDYKGITAENCPNLTKFMEEGINFKNFYSSRFGNTFTFGTETAINTGLFAPSGAVLSTDYVENSFPYSLASMFKADGYSANEFHFNTADYYNRGVMSKVFGFDNYIEFEKYAENKDQLFEVDDTVVTDNGLYNELTKNDKFLDYIVTYSAHLPYSIYDTVYLEAIKRHPELKTDDLYDKLSIYRAKASLTDDMAGELVERLEQDGLMENTVILFITDHFCADLADNDVSEALISNTPCFIYAKGIEPQTVEKVCNTSDILPTLINLFGMENCGEYIGSDIFDDSYDGYACFQNLSWITNDFYYSGGSIAKNYTGAVADDDFIEKMNEMVRERIDINNQILFNDYYKQ